MSIISRIIEIFDYTRLLSVLTLKISYRGRLVENRSAITNRDVQQTLLVVIRILTLFANDTDSELKRGLVDAADYHSISNALSQYNMMYSINNKSYDRKRCLIVMPPTPPSLPRHYRLSAKSVLAIYSKIVSNTIKSLERRDFVLKHTRLKQKTPGLRNYIRSGLLQRRHTFTYLCEKIIVHINNARGRMRVVQVFVPKRPLHAQLCHYCRFSLRLRTD